MIDHYICLDSGEFYWIPNGLTPDEAFNLDDYTYVDMHSVVSHPNTVREMIKCLEKIA